MGAMGLPGRRGWGLRAAAFVVSAALLLTPAIWNGFPLLQYDTGGYLARWTEGTLEASRSPVYGLPLFLLSWGDLWPAAILQAALAVWVLALVLRVHGFARPWTLVGFTALLTLTTSLPWLASVLLTDVFAGLGVLALYLLLFADAALRRGERIALVLTAALAAAVHSATCLMLIGLVLVALVAALALPQISRAGVLRAVAALMLGVVLLLVANAITARRLAWTPGGPQILFGRLLQDGIVAQFLADRCPDTRFRLCKHRHELPRDADAFFWGQKLFDRLGRFEGLGKEMRTIVLESLAAYPLRHAGAALSATARQLLMVGSGEGVIDTLWHTYAIVKRDAPAAVPAMLAARQQRGQLDFWSVNRIQVPLALFSMLLLLPIALFGQQHHPPVAQLAVAVGLAILLNALVCGAVSNPHDRYGARLAWLAPFVMFLTLAWLSRHARSAAFTSIPIRSAARRGVA